LKLLLSAAYSIGYIWIPDVLLLKTEFLASADDVDAEVFLGISAGVWLSDDSGLLVAFNFDCSRPLL
jgi:hypothetical protein